VIPRDPEAPIGPDAPFGLDLSPVDVIAVPGLLAALSGVDLGGRIIRLLAEEVADQTGMPPTEVLASARKLAERFGISVEEALQIIAQSMQPEQLQSSRYA
jgi:hypothetical protein